MGKFKHLVDSEEGMKNFRTKYNIPPHVGIRYAAQGEWFDERKTGEVVILMIAFIEGGMTTSLIFLSSYHSPWAAYLTPTWGGKLYLVLKFFIPFSESTRCLNLPIF